MFRIVAVALSITLLWGVPETIVRLTRPRLRQFRGISFGGDDNSYLLFQKDPRLKWRLRPNTRVVFLETLVRVNSDGFRGPAVSRSGRTVLCLGDSTTFGWRIPDGGSFPARLEAGLRTRRPEDRWQVLNAGVPGYSSYQVRLQAERLLPKWRPEVVVICVGNNAGWPVRRSDREIDESGRFRAVLERFVSHSWFLVWLRERLLPRRGTPFTTAPSSHAVPRVSREEFAENLGAVIRLARSQGTRPVLLSPPVNLYEPPFVTRQLPGEENQMAWFAEMLEHVETGETAAVLGEVEQVLARTPQDHYALWLKGALLSAAGEIAAGRVLLEAALEQHPFPEGAKLSYQQIVRDVAVAENVEFFDVRELFRQASGGGTPDWLYLDHVHPTEEGHRLIAERLIPLILGPEPGLTRGAAAPVPGRR